MKAVGLLCRMSLVNSFFFYLTVYNVQYILNIMTNGNITLIYSFVTICEQNRKDFIVHGSGERPS